MYECYQHEAEGQCGRKPPGLRGEKDRKGREDEEKAEERERASPERAERKKVRHANLRAFRDT